MSMQEIFGLKRWDGRRYRRHVAALLLLIAATIAGLIEVNLGSPHSTSRAVANLAAGILITTSTILLVASVWSRARDKRLPPELRSPTPPAESADQPDRRPGYVRTESGKFIKKRNVVALVVASWAVPVLIGQLWSSYKGYGANGHIAAFGIAFLAWWLLTFATLAIAVARKHARDSRSGTDR